MFSRIRPYIPPAVFAFLIVYFAVQGLIGERGVLGRDARAEALEARTVELARLQAERRDLEARVRLLRDDNLSRDLLEERARSLLGFADPRDFVIRLPRETPAEDAARS